MKKIIALILAAIMCAFCFAGCAEEEKLVCGVTIFKKMNELDADGNWTGFETEFAQAVGEKIGMEVDFKEIDWEQKYMELESGKIDCVWNGFTANSIDKDGVARKDKVDFTYGYMLNQQCVVINKANAETIKTEADLAGKTAVVENGSAGDSYAATVTDADKVKGFPAQNNTFIEVKSGKADFAVVDIILAQNICGKGNYEDLMIVDTIELSSEIYAGGFKKGSDLTEKVNKAIEELFEDGTVEALAKKYGFENTIKLIKEF